MTALCEVCQEPTDDDLYVTFASPDGGCVVLFCRACAAAIFRTMADRYNAVIDAHNANVEHMLRLLGIKGLMAETPRTAEDELAELQAAIEEVRLAKEAIGDGGIEDALNAVAEMSDAVDRLLAIGQPPDPNRIESACPNCGAVESRLPYDIGSGPELSCASCESCWGASGQELSVVTPDLMVAQMRALEVLEEDQNEDAQT